ncbi:ADP-ribosylation factor-binding protein GGA2 [Meyerozyma sp. JA9]|nr:ADP-ribosylation factor-binding protein GGA2 [Meyerozyma sp. JA9]
MSSSGSLSLSKINPKLLRRIYRACRPTLNEPNLALNLEICDYVNAKQGSTPREAAIAVVKLISQKDPQTSELALALLDNLVKNCGYPFQLQISRKEFLNELVRRFPERPPLRYTRVQRMILAQIEEWYQTICCTSKYKSDFGYIRDMHRLLANKGYVFPEVNFDDAAVLNPSDNLKSLEELQNEESVVNSAKLQEFIRRGRPQDLQEANKLMKIMAGFKDDNVEANKKQVTNDVARLKRKTEILAEMMNTMEANGGSIDSSDETLSDLYGSVKSSQPIVTKIIEEGNGDEEYVQELLQLNDVINSLVTKFQLLKGGNTAEASKIKVSGGSGGSNDLNLIDFDDDAPISNDQTGKDNQGYQDLLSDLSNLAFTDTGNSQNIFGAGGSIALGTQPANSQPSLPGQNSSSSSSIQNPTPTSNFDLLSDLHSPSPQLQSNTSAKLDPFSFDTSSMSFANQSAQLKQLHASPTLKCEVQMAVNGTTHSGKFLFSNPQAAAISNFKFLVAVPKSCKLTLQPQTGDVIYPFTTHSVSQEFSIENPMSKQLKVKWKVEYRENNEHKEETGVTILD